MVIDPQAKIRIITANELLLARLTKEHILFLVLLQLRLLQPHLLGRVTPGKQRIDPKVSKRSGRKLEPLAPNLNRRFSSQNQNKVITSHPIIILRIQRIFTKKEQSYHPGQIIISLLNEHWIKS